MTTNIDELQERVNQVLSNFQKTINNMMIKLDDQNKKIEQSSLSVINATEKKTIKLKSNSKTSLKNDNNRKLIKNKFYVEKPNRQIEILEEALTLDDEVIEDISDSIENFKEKLKDK